MNGKKMDGSEDSADAKRVPKWEPKSEWWLHGKDFLVVVKHHLVEYGDYLGGHNLWNVYAYIYPKHWHFNAFEGEVLFQDAAVALPLHSGPSYCSQHRDAKGITAYQVGSDYNHNGDEWFRSAKPEDHFPNGTVFMDAMELFDWLSTPKEDSCLIVASPDSKMGGG